MAAAASSRAHAQTQPSRRDLIVIGASAGGVEALQQLVRSFPEDLPAAVVVVLHVLAGGRSLLASILQRSGRLPASTAIDGAELELGHIYVAPSDYHVLVEDNRLRLGHGPRENGHRPAIDLLFRSAAQERGPRAIGIVLSGLLDDGAAGLRDIKDRGGIALVQSPDDAIYPAMPRNAIASTDVDAVLPVAAMAEAITDLLAAELETPAVTAAAPTTTPAGREDLTDVRLASGTTGGPSDAGDAVSDPEAAPGVATLLEGRPTGLTCPDCGGALWHWRDGALERFGCHVGHSFSVHSMLDAQGRALETALWSALRALEERATLLQRLAHGSSGITRRNFQLRARRAEEHAKQLRETLSAVETEPADDIDVAPGAKR